MNLWTTLVWPGGGVIGLLLWLLSMVTMALIIYYLISIRRVNILPELIRQDIEELLDGKKYRDAIDMTSTQPDYMSFVINSALVEAPHGYAAMERAMEEAGEERTTKSLRQIEWLNLIGNIAPMMGLLGTVWGMIMAFDELGKSTQGVDPSKLAPSIGLALVTTLLGLAVAIPSLSLYSILRNKIDSLTSEAMMVCQEMVSNFRPVRK